MCDTKVYGVVLRRVLGYFRTGAPVLFAEQPMNQAACLALSEIGIVRQADPETRSRAAVGTTGDTTAWVLTSIGQVVLDALGKLPVPEDTWVTETPGAGLNAVFDEQLDIVTA